MPASASDAEPPKGILAHLVDMRPTNVVLSIDQDGLRRHYVVTAMRGGRRTSYSIPTQQVAQLGDEAAEMAARAIWSMLLRALGPLAEPIHA